ncbi:MAG: biosynthetic arginine decarboxylase [Verrucomicrobiota bacterium]|jgi:arginine decarboxylase|nr:biosynthetic arginine decarboxylase [Verrucomicrobiota bacterium]
MSHNSPNILSEEWSIDAAKRRYHIAQWSGGYFDIDDEGNVISSPKPDDCSVKIRLSDVIKEARQKNLRTPLLIRFQDILQHRVQTINSAFHKAIAEFNYRSSYRGVFPIKVNQLREVVEEILEAGKPYQIGLEVGSKPELFAALAIQENPESLIICNGYKDKSYIQTALMGQKMGKTVVLVIEKMEELSPILAVSKAMGIKPTLGVRVKLWSKGDGKWAASGGENAKFGLGTADLLELAKHLNEINLAECFRLLHFHIGSQVPDIFTVKKAVQEASRYYAKLYKLGYPIQWFDVGGGLAVDYDGSRSKSDSSKNYSLQEYANDVVYHLAEVCNEEGVPHPEIISESGRTIVAHHSVLVVEAFGRMSKSRKVEQIPYSNNEHEFVGELRELQESLKSSGKMEAWHDAKEIKEAAQSMFNLGILELEDKAKVESLYWEISRAVVQDFEGRSMVPAEIQQLSENLSDQYLCNFSVFQSLIDHWALNQLFPVMPLRSLDQPPEQEARLVDITCDSDGQVSHFIGQEKSHNTLSLHLPSITGPDPYQLGFFLMGAYQDIMGDMHNLFGRVNEVHVFIDPNQKKGYYIEEIIEGASIASVLDMVQYNENTLIQSMKTQIDNAVLNEQLAPSEGSKMLDHYKQGLRDQTYLSL